jgi:hypothetical protein
MRVKIRLPRSPDHKRDRREQPLLLSPVENPDTGSPPAGCSRCGSVDKPTARRAPRRRRRALVVLAGDGRTGVRTTEALVRSLTEVGFETINLGREESAPRIAAIAATEQADTVELCLARPGGVLLLRALLRELIDVGRRDVSIVVHRI